MEAATSSPWRAGATLLRPHVRSFAAMGGVLAGASAVALGGPLLLRAFIDRALAGDPTSTLVALAVGYVAVAVVAPAVELAVHAVATSLIWRVVNELRVRLARHVLDQDRAFHSARSPGALVERVDGDLTALADFAATFVLTVVRVALTAAGAILVVAVLDARVAGALAAYVLVAGVVFVTLRNLTVADAEAERGAHGQMHGHIEEYLVGLEDLRANGGRQWVLDQHAADARRALAATQGRERSAIRLWHSASGVVTGGAFVALVAGAYAHRAGVITLGTAFLLFQYTQVLAQPMFQVLEQLESIQQAAGGLQRALDLLQLPVRSIDRGDEAMPDGAPAVVFAGVGFTYGDEVVLDDVSFTLGAGRSLGVVGRTGAGKTTLSRLILGDVVPTVGQVRIGGVDVVALDPEALARRVGVVTQEVHLFGASVRDNVTLFDHTVDDDAVVDALRRVGLGHRLLGGRASGSRPLDRRLDGTGSGLSGGEAQLLALARVLVRDPDLVVLDEATARVDPATEHDLRRAMATILEGRTAVVIAHRLRTLDIVDDILVLDHGRVVEHGPRVDLLAAGGEFAELYHRAGSDHRTVS